MLQRGQLLYCTLLTDGLSAIFKTLLDLTWVRFAMTKSLHLLTVKRAATLSVGESIALVAPLLSDRDSV
jgi:hypothetical protein